MFFARSLRSRLLIAALAVPALGGCAQAQAAQARVGSLIGPRNAGLRGREKVFSVLWWTKADETEGLPYKPLEPASPERDPQSGSVFVATSGDGKVHAFRADGTYLWDTEVGGPFEAGPTVAGDRLLVGSDRGSLHALSLADGHELWAYAAGEALVTRPVVAEGTALVMTASDTLLAIDAETGAWKWQYRREQPDVFTIEGAARPLVDENRVLAGFADGFAVALDLADGGVLWAKQLSKAAHFSDVDAGPVMDADGRAYFASYGSGVFCIDPATGETIWSQDRPGVTSLAIDPSEGTLFAGGAGFVAALGLDGGLPRWTLSMRDERYVSGLTVADGLVLAATGRGPLLFLDGRSGRLHRAFDPGHGVSAAATQTARGDALVLSNRGFVYNLAIEAAAQ